MAQQVYETLLTREELAIELGRHSATIRNWEKAGVITAEPKKRGRHKLYSLHKVLVAIGQDSLEKYTIIFINMKSAKDKEMIEEQINLSKQFCTANGWRFIVLSDDKNDPKDSLAIDALMSALFEKKVERLILPNNCSVSMDELRLLTSLCKTMKIPLLNIEEKLNICEENSNLVIRSMKAIYPDSYDMYLKKALENESN